MGNVRSAIWRLGAPVRAVAIGLIRLYRVTLSGVLGGQCRFYPSCSSYGEDAIRTYGVLRGSAMTGWRILRCQPFTRGGVDHVKPRRGARQPYEAITQGGPG